MPHSFGVSGKLRFSDMIMHDRQTQSWWQQAVGEAGVGHHMGKTLTLLRRASFQTREGRCRPLNGCMYMIAHMNPFVRDMHQGNRGDAAMRLVLGAAAAFPYPRANGIGRDLSKSAAATPCSVRSSGKSLFKTCAATARPSIGAIMIP